LEIDPSDLYGRGKGSYRMTAGEKEVWRAELPFTLCDAAVSDEGITTGYAYSHGLEGMGRGGYKEGRGSLAIVIIDAAGAVRLNETVKRKLSLMMHAPPEPVANGFTMHPRDDRFVMRLGSESGESWWVYRLSTGETVKRFELRAAAGVAESARFVPSAKAVPELPLTLVHWWLYDQDTGKSGALFMLCDFDGRSVWTLELPADYMIANDEEAESRLRRMVQKSGAILRASEPGAFELWFAAAGERVRFEVVRDAAAPKGWRVNERSREKYLPPGEEKPVVAEKRPLPHLGSFVLQDNPPPRPIRDIDAFAFDGLGRIGFLRSDDGEGYAFVLLDPSGPVLAEVALPMAADSAAHIAWIADSRWIVTASEHGIEKKSRGWWLDAEKQSLAEIAGFDCPSVESVAGTGDGGFVVLATRQQRYSTTDQLIGFDPSGKPRWNHEVKYGLEPGALFSPEDITVTTHMEIAVLDNIRNTVQLFAVDGAHRRTIALKKAWKREPNYPSAITPDVDGGFIVFDFDSNPPFVRMKPDGSTRGTLRPKHVDGRPIDAHTGLRGAPDGSLWASDGHSFVQLRDNGVASRIVGSPPDETSLGKISAITGDQRGQLYAVDERTGAVHVFDANGAKLRVGKPAKDDFSGNVRFVHVAADDDGSVFVATENHGAPRYLHFAPDGRRLGIERLDVDAITQEWYPQPGTGNLLVLGYHAAFLVDRAGKIVRTIERRPDRGWLDSPDDAAFASDGSFAILAGSTQDFSREQTISLFTRDGEPISMFRFADGFAQLRGFNGTHVTLGIGEDILIFDRHGAAVQRFAGPKPRGQWDHFLTRDGRELWVVEFAARKVDRYAMP
jgi:sugar lactone lactonase YvrE